MSKRVKSRAVDSAAENIAALMRAAQAARMSGVWAERLTHAVPAPDRRERSWRDRLFGTRPSPLNTNC